ncbi:MAG TPA: phosphoribosylanthranilate isomerase, partial [Anaeromyxobacteraceae bacterium]|nr:phosphoribosylanthranilate isomerase [Anaeromyxobacteraceae bacterium]
GITRLEDALAAARLGAAALGFNFWPRSSRFVAADDARAIIAALPPFVTAVGVFVDQPEEELRAVAARTGIQVFQLHGDEPPALCARLPLPVVKAIPADRAADRVLLASYPVRAFLLDTPSPDRGGTGRTFDWSLAAGVAEVAPVILAGGLRPENVAEAVRAVRPWAVDVASGVESSPGVKDPERMARFVDAVREVRLP